MKAKELRVGDVVTKRGDLAYGKVGKVSRIEKRDKYCLKVYFEGFRNPAIIHSNCGVVIANKRNLGFSSLPN